MQKKSKDSRYGVSYGMMNAISKPLLSLAILLGLMGACFAAPKEPVNFTEIKLDGKHAVRASWSLQGDAGVLQIQLPAHRDDEPGPKVPLLQVWLLQSDGSSSNPSHHIDSPVGISMRGFTTPSLAYEFARKDADAAVAIVIQVEKKFFVHSIAKDPAENKKSD